jgi:JAB1/Mov34/MPN/PAD-1 ubiquitin protease
MCPKGEIQLTHWRSTTDSRDREGSVERNAQARLVKVDIRWSEYVGQVTMPATTTAETFALTSTQVIVHPLVLLSAVDHYNRAAKGTKKRVVGILLGQNNGSSINVANSFAGTCNSQGHGLTIVPFEEDDKDPSVWFLDHTYIEEMNTMFKKINGTFPRPLPACLSVRRYLCQPARR